MKFNNLYKILMFGLLATGMMVIYSFLAPIIGLPSDSYREVIFVLLPNVTPFTSWVYYFIIGVSLALLYYLFLKIHLPAQSWVKGLYFSVGLWLITQIIVYPLVGMGFFQGSFIRSLGVLIELAIYGASLGYFYKK